MVLFLAIPWRSSKASAIKAQILFADFAAGAHAQRERELLPQLHPLEQARYRAFGHARRRQMWLAGRELVLAALARDRRRVVVRSLRTDARGAIRYRTGGVHVSLSHSGDLLAVALASAPVGVDMERPQPRTCVRQAGRLFAQAEAQYLQALEPDGCQSGFYALWTLKEAVTKAAGMNLWDSLGNAVFDLHARRCTVHPPLPPAKWICMHARTACGWHLALATPSGENLSGVQCWHRSPAGEWLAEHLLEPIVLRSAASMSCAQS